MTLLERLQAAPAYTPQELGGTPFGGTPYRRVDEELGTATMDRQVILVGVETRDEIIAILEAINVLKDVK